MTKRQTPEISSRKQPQQARSTAAVSNILEAATQVLAKEGAARFTTARVAEKAGVSVGSVYQYFPNKAAVLFRLQANEWKQTTDMLRRILENDSQAPEQRLRRLVHAFFKAECDEAEMRGALDDAAPLYRHAAEAKEARDTIDLTMQKFLESFLPQAPAGGFALVSDVVLTSMSALGKKFSSDKRSKARIQECAEAAADMFWAYLQQLR